jgi:hypothetical protein
MSPVEKATWIAVAVAVSILVFLVNVAYTHGLIEGREQACARLSHDEEASWCAQLIEKDVDLDERTTKDMEAKWSKNPKPKPAPPP